MPVIEPLPTATSSSLASSATSGANTSAGASSHTNSSKYVPIRPAFRPLLPKPAAPNPAEPTVHLKSHARASASRITKKRPSQTSTTLSSSLVSVSPPGSASHLDASGSATTIISATPAALQKVNPASVQVSGPKRRKSPSAETSKPRQNKRKLSLPPLQLSPAEDLLKPRDDSLSPSDSLAGTSSFLLKSNRDAEKAGPTMPLSMAMLEGGGPGPAAISRTASVASLSRSSTPFSLNSTSNNSTTSTLACPTPTLSEEELSLNMDLDLDLSLGLSLRTAKSSDADSITLAATAAVEKLAQRSYELHQSVDSRNTSHPSSFHSPTDIEDDILDPTSWAAKSSLDATTPTGPNFVQVEDDLQLGRDVEPEYGASIIDSIPLDNIGVDQYLASNDESDSAFNPMEFFGAKLDMF